MIQGEIHALPLSDLIQWLALTRRTGKLTLTQSATSLEFYFIAGDMAGATDEALSVVDSAEKLQQTLGRVYDWQAGRFAFIDDELPKWVTLVNLRLSAESILYNLTSQFNEAQKPDTQLQLNAWAEAGKGIGLLTDDDAIRLRVVDQLLRDDFNVPAMPQLAIRVLELTRNKNFSLRELGSTILTDQAVAARVLRYANSARQGTEKEIDSLALAVQRLGTDEVVSVVLAATLQARRPGQELFAAEKRRLWVYSSIAAFFARTIAANVGLERNLGFLCGLLMDFGRNVLYTAVQDMLIGRSSPKQIPVQVIKKIVRDFHSRVGGVVGEKWRLPTTVTEVMAYHHCLEQAPPNNHYVAVAALTDYLVNFALNLQHLKFEEALADFSPERLVSHPAAPLLNLRTKGATQILSSLPSQLDQAQEFIAQAYT